MNLASYKAGNNFKTFVLVAALTGLLAGRSGTSSAVRAGLILFAAHRRGLQLRRCTGSAGPIALKMSKAVPVSEAEAPELHRDDRRARRRAPASRSPPST